MAQGIVVLWAEHAGSDWVGIYKDGSKIYEGHPPSFDDALSLLSVDYSERVTPSATMSTPGVRGLPASID